MSYDVGLQLLDPGAQTTRALLTFGPTPRLVRGPQKVLTRWLKILLTPKGSHPVRRSEGTGFALLVRRPLAELRGAEALVAEYVEDAADQVRAFDRAEPQRPADERLAAAAVLRFVETSPTSVDVWVELVTADGQRLRSVLPYASG